MCNMEETQAVRKEHQKNTARCRENQEAVGRGGEQWTGISGGGDSPLFSRCPPKRSSLSQEDGSTALPDDNAV